jgi:hypothetical protein
MENESKTGKALFGLIMNISIREMYYSGSNIINLGRHLKIITKTIITAYSTLGREK